MFLTDHIDPNLYPEPARSRLICWRHTKAICDQLPQIEPDIKIKASSFSGCKRYHETIIKVLDQDCLEVARDLSEAGKRVAVLNLADDCMPLGYPEQSGAQEESIARRTNLCQHLHISNYPIQDDAGIYSKNVIVFKDTEQKGYSLIKPFRVDILTVPGVKMPTLDEHGHMLKSDIARLEIKIRLMFQMAFDNDVDRLILSATGCGAWKCPPHDVAQTFKRVMKEYDGVCEMVCFAVMKHTKDMLCTHRGVNAECNYEVFFKVLLDPEDTVSPDSERHHDTESGVEDSSLSDSDQPLT